MHTYIQTHTNKQRAKCMCMCYLGKFFPTKLVSLCVFFLRPLKLGTNNRLDIKQSRLLSPLTSQLQF